MKNIFTLFLTLLALNSFSAQAKEPCSKQFFKQFQDKEAEYMIQTLTGNLSLKLDFDALGPSLETVYCEKGPNGVTITRLSKNFGYIFINGTEMFFIESATLKDKVLTFHYSAEEQNVPYQSFNLSSKKLNMKNGDVYNVKLD